MVCPETPVPRGGHPRDPKLTVERQERRKCSPFNREGDFVAVGARGFDFLRAVKAQWSDSLTSCNRSSRQAQGAVVKVVVALR